jgi:hypothetical protein
VTGTGSVLIRAQEKTKMITQDQIKRISLALPIIQPADTQLIRELQQAAVPTKIPKVMLCFLRAAM